MNRPVASVGSALDDDLRCRTPFAKWFVVAAWMWRSAASTGMWPMAWRSVAIRFEGEPGDTRDITTSNSKTGAGQAAPHSTELGSVNDRVAIFYRNDS